MQRPIAILATVGTVLALFVSGGTVASAAVRTQGGVGCGPVVTTIKNVRSAGTAIQSPSGPNWSVAGRGPGTLTLSKSVAVGNSISGATGISGAVASANVGFNVTATFTTATGYSVSVPSGQTRVLRADELFSVKKFDWTTKQSCNTTGLRTASGTATAKRFERLQYRSYRS